MEYMQICDLAKFPNFPYADEFPYISEDEEKELAQDLEINGQQHPIVIFEDQILDGRNRIKAFGRTNLTEAMVEYFEGTEFQAVEKVRSLNILRRHLTVGQRAMAALAYLPYEEDEAKKRADEGRRKGLAAMNEGSTTETDPSQRKDRAPQSRDVVAEKFNLAGPRISDAKKLSLTTPDLAAEVKAGTLSLDGATKQMKARSESRDKKARELEFEAPDLHREYVGGRVALDEAYITLINRQKEEARRKAASNNEAVNLIVTYARISDERLREFNLKIQKLVSIEKIDEALGHIESVSGAISVTRGALERLRSILEEDRDDDVLVPRRG